MTGKEDMLLFGSSYPDWRMASPDDLQWVAKHIPAGMREKVMFGNAIELFKLPSTVPGLVGQKRAF